MATRKFTSDEVRRIRSSKIKTTRLAEQYGVTRQAINRIKTRQSYSHVVGGCHVDRPLTMKELELIYDWTCLPKTYLQLEEFMVFSVGLDAFDNATSKHLLDELRSAIREQLNERGYIWTDGMENPDANESVEAGGANATEGT